MSVYDLLYILGALYRQEQIIGYSAGFFGWFWFYFLGIMVC